MPQQILRNSTFTQTSLVLATIRHTRIDTVLEYMARRKINTERGRIGTSIQGYARCAAPFYARKNSRTIV